jgi:hypothetical protein
MARRYSVGPRPGRGKVVHWLVLLSATVVSVILVVLAFTSYSLGHGAVFYGFFGPAMLSFTFTDVIMRNDDRERARHERSQDRDDDGSRR